MKPWDDPRIARGMQAQLAKRRVHVDAGDMPLGWKVGFGAPAAMTKLGITAPLVGFLMRPALVPSGTPASLTGWTKPVAEPEIAVHMARDLPADASDAATKAAIAALGPAIELADLEFPPDDVEAILAGNIYQRHVILGAFDPDYGSGRTDGLLCRVMRRGAECARTGDPQAATGEIVGIVRRVANVLAAFGERLRAGEVIITGSVVPPLFVEPGEEMVSFALDPIGDVSVRFKW